MLVCAALNARVEEEGAGSLRNCCLGEYLGGKREAIGRVSRSVAAVDGD